VGHAKYVTVAPTNGLRQGEKNEKLPVCFNGIVDFAGHDVMSGSGPNQDFEPDNEWHLFCGASWKRLVVRPKTKA